MRQARSADARGNRLRAGGIAALLALVATGIGPPGTATGGASATLPDEPGAIRIEGPSYSALVADVDGDDRTELVRITNRELDESMAVEIWRQARNGTWSASPPEAPLRRGLSPDERVNGIRGDRDGMVPVQADDVARLVSWHQAGRRRTLAIVNAGTSNPDRTPCCMTVWEVTSGRNGSPSLRLLIGTDLGADSAYAVDMDGDGADELAVRQPPSNATPAAFSVLRWSAGRFRVAGGPLNAGEVLGTYRLGNSDGRPGEEIGLVGSFGSGSAFGLTRVSLRAGAIHDETVDLPSDGAVLSVPAARGDGPATLVFGDSKRGVAAFSWPADGDLTQVASSSHRGRPIAVIGSGANARIMLMRTDPPALDLIAPSLSDGSFEGVRAADPAKPFFATTYPPYVGPWPDPPAGHVSAQVYAGTLIRASAGAAPSFASMAILPGTAPLGSVAADGAWTALAQRTSPALGTANLAPDGGPLLQNDAFDITLVRTADVLAPEQAGGGLRPAIHDAVIDPGPSAPGVQGLVTGLDAFDATVTAPVDSVAVVVTGTAKRVHPLVDGPVVTAGRDITGPPFRVPITSPGFSDDKAFDAALQVITPAGHGYTARWHVRLLHKPPGLGAESSFLSLSLTATISGRTDPAASVTVEGQTVRPGADGRYQVNVPAGLAPRDVVVRARDPFGHVASVSVSVAAPVDYRRLPWIPIMVVLTILAGAILFVRAPRLVAHPPAGRADEGTFEEIDSE